jgi:ATP-dependent RNA helicase RhlE
MEKKMFKELNLGSQVEKAVLAAGYENPTPIQEQCIPPLLLGKDLIGCAQTGTGKTAAFALPILTMLAKKPVRPEPRMPRVLVLTPTRELAAQVGESFKCYSRFMKTSHALVFGGVRQGPQVKALSRGVDVLVATPGRLLDLMNQRHVKLSSVEFFVLDEADRMLDMGFMPDIKRIIATLPQKRQSLLFSATMPSEIRTLAEKLLNDPVSVSVAPQAMTADNIIEKVLFVEDGNKKDALKDILDGPDVERALVFTRTKRGADKVAKNLGRKANAIHGNKSQSARIAALSEFRSGKCRVLVATDIASRGIDVAGITHVINYDMPSEPESYVHRIGRTARAGAAGTAISLCGTGDRLSLRDIERLIKRTVPVFTDHAYYSPEVEKSCAAKKMVFTSKRGRSGRARSSRW